MAVDSHVHLTQKTDLDAARGFGVSLFLCAAAKSDDWDAVFNIAETDSAVAAFIGTHPWYADTYDAEILNRALLSRPRAGIGEIGLDGRRGKSEQTAVFKSQLDIAVALNRPVVVHCVKAMPLLCPILKQYAVLPPLLFHAFSGDANDVRFLTRRGAYFSLNAAHAEKFSTLLPLIPADRLLFDSDAPFMKPADPFCIDPTAPKNRSENVILTLRYAAKVLKTTLEALDAATTHNARAFLSPLGDFS